MWGYEGSAGDVDWSWDYHIMMNEFRRHPKVCGWLYTEHHDVINEWNGYYRFDRSDKFTGLEELVPGMTLRDLHAPFYISTGSELCRDVKPGEQVTVPLWASFMTDRAPSRQLRLRAMLTGWDTLGQRQWFSRRPRRTIAFQPWLSKEIEPLEVTMPDKPGLAMLEPEPGGRSRHRAAPQLHHLPGRRRPRAARRRRSNATARKPACCALRRAASRRRSGR